MASTTTSYPSIFITGHEASGLSVFTEVKPKAVNDNLLVVYGSTVSPINLAEASDIGDHETTPIELVPKDGCRTVICRFAPKGADGPVSRIHRTLSVDIGVMVEGSVEAILDSGEKRLLKKGDTLIQRGTMHGWRNPSETEIATMLIITLPAEEPTVGGKAVAGTP